MARLLRVLLRVFTSACAVGILACLFLLGWHTWRDSRLIKAGRSSRAGETHFAGLPPLRLPQNPLHVLPVPSQVQERQGTFTCPRPLGVTSTVGSQAWAEEALSIALQGVFPCRGRAAERRDARLPAHPREGRRRCGGSADADRGLSGARGAAAPWSSRS